MRLVLNFVQTMHAATIKGFFCLFVLIILPRSARQANLTVLNSANTQTQTEPVKAHRFHSAL